MQKLENYIGGKLLAPLSGNYIDNYDPSRGKVYSLIPRSAKEDVQLAYEAAETAFKTWSTTPASERGRIMQTIADLIQERLDELAEAESLDNGKPLKLASHVDIPRASQNFSFFATGIQHFSSESHNSENAINFTLRKPIGVVGCISPWNLPLYLFTWKIAPALAAGNCVVAKPSEVTPMTAYLLSKLCIEAGLPPGVLNIVHGLGHECGNEIVSHPKIKAISFTGGTSTGAHIAKIAAPMFKKLSLELGGKNPTLVFADCDFEDTVSQVVRASFANQGQICLCGSRILIEESIYDKFKEAFLEKVRKTKVGAPNDPTVHMGALVSKDHMEKVISYIELAKEEGGVILHGGNRVNVEGEFAEGYYLEPTVIEGLDQNCRTNTEEIFGPVVTLQKFKSEEKALQLANATEYGLATSVWTTNIKRSQRLAQQLDFGIVWINCWLLRDLRTPFGGMKNSGVGREGGWEALKFFTEPTNVCIKL